MFPIPRSNNFNACTHEYSYLTLAQFVPEEQKNFLTSSDYNHVNASKIVSATFIMISFDTYQVFFIFGIVPNKVAALPHLELINATQTWRRLIFRSRSSSKNFRSRNFIIGTGI